MTFFISILTSFIIFPFVSFASENFTPLHKSPFTMDEDVQFKSAANPVWSLARSRHFIGTYFRREASVADYIQVDFYDSPIQATIPLTQENCIEGVHPAVGSISGGLSLQIFRKISLQNSEACEVYIQDTYPQATHVQLRAYTFDLSGRRYLAVVKVTRAMVNDPGQEIHAFLNKLRLNDSEKIRRPDSVSKPKKLKNKKK